MISREVYTDVGTIDAEDVPRTPLRPRGPDYPDRPAPEAFRGLLGELVAAMEPHTEADSVAILVQALAAFGSVIGRSAHFVADGTPHYTNLYAVIVAASAKGRKGTSWSHVRNCFTSVDPNWPIVGGLSSGEGLIWHVRDAHYVEREVRRAGRLTGERETTLDDAGVEDKRLFVAESEFAKVLRVCERDGCTLSPVLREAWDSGNLATLTKNGAAKATGAHVSVIGHVTAEELRRYLTATEAGNGFGNRFLWVCARRSKYLPDGGTPDEGTLAAIRNDFGHAVRHARACRELRRDRAASDHWRAIYCDLSEGRPGLLGSMTGRAEAQVMRLSMIYALADGASIIELAHLEAGLALWRYCFDSARFIFGDSLGHSAADDLLGALLVAGAAGMARAEMSREVFGKNRSAREITQALALLSDLHLARVEVDRSGAGRPVQHWYYTGVTN